MCRNEWKLSIENYLCDRMQSAVGSVSFEIRVRKLNNVQLEWQNDWTSYLNIFKQKRLNLAHWTFLTAFKIDWTTLNITELDWTRLDKVAKWRNILHWTNVHCMFSANVQWLCQGFIRSATNTKESRPIKKLQYCDKNIPELFIF